MRLSRLVPSNEIPDYMIDIIYSKFVHKSKNTFNPIVESNFKNFLMDVALLKFPNDVKEDGLMKLARFYLFPFLLWNSP